MSVSRQEEMMVDESISQLTSKMPTPPPRPASLASSTRSSKRSSAASVMTNSNTKHFETDASEAPPTPSIAEYYNTNGAVITSSSITSPIVSQRPSSSFMSLGEELALTNQQDISASARSSVASTSANLIPRDYSIYQQSERMNHNSNNGHSIKSSRPSAITRVSTSSTASNGSSTVRRKSSKQTQRAGEGPTIVIGIRSSGTTINSDNSSYRSSRTYSSNSEHQKPQRPPRSSRNSENSKKERLSVTSPSNHTLPRTQKFRRLKSMMQSSLSFVTEVAKAFYKLWSQVLFPLLLAILGTLNISQKTDNRTKSDAQSVSHEKQNDTQQSSDQSFAEKFKFALCTSNLLTTSLAISSYDAPVPEIKKDEKEVKGEQIPIPTSIIEFRQIQSVLSEGDLDPIAVTSSSSSQIQISKGAQTLLKSCAVAVLFLIPFSSSKDVWLRSVLLLTSLMWGIVAVFGVRTLISISYELSHVPSGSYRPSLYDVNASEDSNGEGINEKRRKQIKEGMQSRLVKLIKACKSFDVECNKALAAIQEIELISRGYKISHPLPPISRIELSNTKAPSSPPRLRNGSLSNLPVGSRGSFTARHLNASGHGQSTNISTAESLPSEPIRMAKLRKSLANAFEDVNGTMKEATLTLKPLGDQNEMNLLRDMYELDANANRRSGSFLAETNDSIAQRTSWNSRGIAPSDLTRPSSSLTNEDQQSSPRTPQNRDSLLDNSLLDRSSSLRKRESGGLWDTPPSMSGSVTNSNAGVRPGSRLSYISDKSPTTVTSFTGPNQNGALKRLSYSSNGSLSGGVNTVLNGTSPFRTSLQPTQRSGSGHNRRQGSVQLALHGASDDARSVSPLPLSTTLHAPVSPNMITSIDGHKIISLKESFEQMHTIRKKALCTLLALDFSLNDVVQIETSSIKSTRQYWSHVGRILNGISDCLTGLSENVKADLQKEISISKENGQKLEDVLNDAPKRDSSGHLIDYSGFQDRLIAMGDSLRSVQIKMRLCADDLQMRGSAPLHGDTSEENGSIISGSEKRASTSTELMFGTIREDLLQLSAEWEAASKIMRVHGLAQQTDSNVNTSVDSTGGSSTTSSLTNTGNSSNTTAGTLLLESPQEAEEDAMREWIKNQKAHLANDISLETVAIEAGIRHMLQHGSKMQEKREEEEENKEDELSSLLLRSTSPQGLPLPGVETVYEDVAFPAAKKQPSNLSREERIRLMKEQRNNDAQQLAMHAKQHTSGSIEMTNGMMTELRSVMKNRRSAIIDGKLQPDIRSHGDDEPSSSERSLSPATPVIQSSLSGDAQSLRGGELTKSQPMQIVQSTQLQRRSARSGSSGRPSLSISSPPPRKESLSSSPISDYQQGFAYGSQRQ